MKIHSILFLAFALLLQACSAKQQKRVYTKENLMTAIPQSTTYLGQKPPGDIPQRFAPDMVAISQKWECCGVPSPNEQAFYFVREAGKISGKKQMEFVMIHYKNNRWQDSVISPRTGTPFMAPNGNTLHLGRRYRQRTSTGEWSEIKKLAAPFKDLPIMRLTASAKGTYFFDEFKKDFTGDIRYSRLINGKYEKPQLLNKEINSGSSHHPFIAPDESYLIFDSERAGGYGDSDLYISFRQKDGTWGKPINLGNKINTPAWDAVASVSPDGKYLFFSRGGESGKSESIDIFWVDAQIIEKLRPKE